MTECKLCWQEKFELLQREIDRKVTYWRMIRDRENESGSPDATSQAVYSEMCELWLAAHDMKQKTLADFEEAAE